MLIQTAIGQSPVRECEFPSMPSVGVIHRPRCYAPAWLVASCPQDRSTSTTRHKVALHPLGSAISACTRSLAISSMAIPRYRPLTKPCCWNLWMIFSALLSLIPAIEASSSLVSGTLSSQRAPLRAPCAWHRSTSTRARRTLAGRPCSIRR